MGRRYQVMVTALSASAVMDILSVTSGAAMAFKIIGFSIGQVTSVTAQMAQVRLIRLPATVTAGSGGSAVTPRKKLKGDTAATVTSRSGDTVQATTSGTAEVLESHDFNSAIGDSFFFPKDDQPTIGLSDAVVLSLDTAFSPALTISATLHIEEIL